MPRIVKVSSDAVAESAGGDVPLATGERIAMRLWRGERPDSDKPMRRQDYEVLGYVLSGHAELDIEGETVELRPGDSWLVPAGANHTYRIRETFSAVEVTSPPASG